MSAGELHETLVRQKDRDVWHADCSCAWWLDCRSEKQARFYADKHVADREANRTDVFPQGNPGRPE